MGRKSTSGGVKPAGDRIEVRFTYRGKDIRPTLDLKPTAPNLRHAARLRASIVQEIAGGGFDLRRYFPDYKFADQVQPDREHKTLREWATTWVHLASRELEHSTLAIYKRHLAAYWLPVFGDQDPRHIRHEALLSHLAALASEQAPDGSEQRPLGRKTQNNILIPLRAVFALACRSLRTDDPTEGIENLRVQKGQPDPFSAAEVAAILEALPAGEVRNFFEFAIFAGLRSSEQIALQWADIDRAARTAHVARVRVLGRDKDRTKTHRARTVELNARAWAVLARQPADREFVFHNPATGRPWHDEQEQRRAWAEAVSTTGVRYRPPKECRDTSVTLALQAGANPVWVAAQHGHSPTVMFRDYSRWIPQSDAGRNRALVDSATRILTP